ncbi:hypothetical protein FDECE_1617, partial [Fusarium decemcellulare]
MVFNEHGQQNYDRPHQMQDLPAGQAYHFDSPEETDPTRQPLNEPPYSPADPARAHLNDPYSPNVSSHPTLNEPYSSHDPSPYSPVYDLPSPPLAGIQRPVPGENDSSRDLLQHDSWTRGFDGYMHDPNHLEPEYDVEASRRQESRLSVIRRAATMPSYDQNETLSVPDDFARGRPDSTFHELDPNESWMMRQQQPAAVPGVGGITRSKTRKVKLVKGSVLSIEYPVPSAIKNAIEPRYRDAPGAVQEEFTKMRYTAATCDPNDFT